MADVHVGYLRDLGVLLRERQAEARDRAATARADSSPVAAFDIGYWQAYNHVLSLMVQQAGVFGLTLSELGLTGIDPERDLVP